MANAVFKELHTIYNNFKKNEISNSYKHIDIFYSETGGNLDNQELDRSRLPAERIGRYVRTKDDPERA